MRCCVEHSITYSGACEERGTMRLFGYRNPARTLYTKPYPAGRRRTPSLDVVLSTVMRFHRWYCAERWWCCMALCLCACKRVVSVFGQAQCGKTSLFTVVGPLAGDEDTHDWIIALSPWRKGLPQRCARNIITHTRRASTSYILKEL